MEKSLVEEMMNLVAEINSESPDGWTETKLVERLREIKREVDTSSKRIISILKKEDVINIATVMKVGCLDGRKKQEMIEQLREIQHDFSVYSKRISNILAKLPDIDSKAEHSIVR
ncbi:MAG: hypothetical protein A2144_08810 [Chloroflexi bacterium RBG_16_50_9]|nr:MAG: hypothetical protein A2144_08810 [Chloroflexi bacterium RBG_16_50_9]